MLCRPGENCRSQARREHMSRTKGGRRKAVCPEIGVLMRYEERVVRAVAEAGGQRVIIESQDENGQVFRSTVRWENLASLSAQLF